MDLSSIKKSINHHVPEIIRKLGVHVNPWILRWSNEESRVLIFYFHGLYKSESEIEMKHVDPQNNITVDQLGEFVQYFKSHGYQFINQDVIESKLDPQGAYVMMTFDDGYFNNTYALGILEKFDVPATFFISTRYVMEESSYWWDVVYKYRVKQGVKLSAIRREQERLKTHSYTYIDDYLLKNFGENCNSPWSDIDRPMSPNELNEFAKHPLVAIGNHTHNHAILTRYKESEIMEEIALANKNLQEITGVTPNSVAFPNGNYNRAIVRIAKQCGLRYAYSTVGRINSLPIHRDEMVVLSRFMAKTTNVERYASFCRLGYSSSGLFESFKKRVLPLALSFFVKTQSVMGDLTLEAVI